ncbi:MAG: serine/threonine protein phosphatase [Balneolales bacterium]|nr:serine/threonine protein phosphatase [Balneolales bacterium]
MTDNPNGYIAIGDIHGCAKTLEALLTNLDAEYGETRTYVFLGDYVDRGPSTKEAIDILLRFRKNHDCVFIRGNHDAMLLDYYSDKENLDYLNFGGAQTLESYYRSCPDHKIPYAHLRFLVSTQLYLDTEHWMFVHGGVPPNMTIAEAIADTKVHDSFLWTRKHLETDDNDWEKTVVFGHTPVRQPIGKNNMIGIDTGCVYEQFGKLTAVVLPEEEFVQISRIDF